MFKIDGNNNIILTRGDSLSLKIDLKFEDGSPYIVSENDVIRFAISKGYEGEPNYQLIKEIIIPNDTLTILLTSEDTKLPYCDYNYDVEITHEGQVDTFISAKFRLTGEVK